MQIKIFTIPILGGEAFNEELNTFLRSHRIISVEDQFVQSGSGGWWVFKVQYGEGAAPANDRERVRVDYKQVLDEATFKRFADLRDIRKKISDAESIPAYVIFTDEELAEMAKLEALTEADMKNIKGIGKKKMEKYGRHFLSSGTEQAPSDEKSR